MPLITGVVRQMLQVSRGHAVVPAMRQGTTDDQVHMARQGWSGTQVMAVAVDLAAQLVAVRRLTVMLVSWRGPVLVDAGRRCAVHFTLVLPQPLALPLGTAVLLLPGWVAMLVLMFVLLVLMVWPALLVGLARRCGAGGGESGAGQQGQGSQQPDGQTKWFHVDILNPTCWTGPGS